MAKKKAQNENIDREEGLREKIRMLDQGRGVEVTLGTPSNTYYFTNKLPKLQSKNLQLEVEFSSAESEDRDLLHYLSQRTR